MFRSLLVFACAFMMAFPAYANDCEKPDDEIAFNLSAEEWVTTKTARVVLNVQAAVSVTNAGSMRADMVKAVNETAKTDWRMTTFDRAQDQTGLDRWNVSFEARLTESDLNGLTDKAKKASKAGMQITVGSMDFTPSLEEMESARAALRERLLKEAGSQLTVLNAALPGRSYRISSITFDADAPHPTFRRGMKKASMERMGAMGMTMAAAPAASDDVATSISQKLVVNAHVSYAALPPVTTARP